MFSDQTQLIHVLMVTMVAIALTFVYNKLTAKEDEHLNKTLFRVGFVVVLSHVIVYYLTSNSKDVVLKEPFFNGVIQHS